MDISPKPPSSPELKSGQRLTTEASIISNVEDLKLETNKLYKAKVIEQLTPKEPAPSDNPNTYLKPDTKNQAIKEWLLSINGKMVKTSGNLPIKSGESLFVKLEASTNIKTNTLTIVRNTAQSSSTNLNPQTIDSSTLLNTLSKLLPRQLSISSGFAAINKINNTISPLAMLESLSNTEGQLQTNAQTKTPLSTATKQNSELTLIKGVIERLLHSLPQAEHITQPNTQDSSGDKSHIVKQAIEKSGIFLEASLLNKEARNQLAAQFQNLRSLTSHLSSGSQSINVNQTNTNPISQSSVESPNLSLSKEARNLLQHLTKQSSTITELSTASDKAIPADLKSTLLGLSQISSSTRASDTQQSNQLQNLDKLLGQMLEPELLNAPFNFPRIHSETSAKAQAILADQELSTGQLLKILAGMLNRIQFNQLNSVYQSQNTDGNTLQSWFLELPIVNTSQEVSSFDIRIDKEKNPGSSQDNDDDNKALQWKLTLSFDLEELGAMFIQVSLLPPSISSVIWADKEDTYRLAKSETLHFKSKLADLGLDVGEIICQKGLPPQQTTKLSQSLVDVQA